MAGLFPGRSGQAGSGAPPGEGKQPVDGRAAPLYGGRRTNCTTDSVQLSRSRQPAHTRLGPAAWGARTQQDPPTMRRRGTYGRSPFSALMPAWSSRRAESGRKRLRGGPPRPYRTHLGGPLRDRAGTVTAGTVTAGTVSAGTVSAGTESQCPDLGGAKWRQSPVRRRVHPLEARLQDL